MHSLQAASEVFATAHGHAVGEEEPPPANTAVDAAAAAAASAAGSRRSNQLKLQELSKPKFLTVEVLSSRKKASVTVDGTTVGTATHVS